MAKYHTIVKEIEESIKRGELRPFDQLPTVVELTKKYHVSRTTIEQATDELEKRGLVSRKRGSGVYVKKVATPVFEKPLNTVSLSRDLGQGLSGKPQCQVHEFTVLKPNSTIVRELGLHEYSFTFYISRSHLYQGSPLDVQYLYYPVEIFRDIRLTSAETSIRPWIADNYEVTPDSFHKTLRAVMPTEEEREILRMKENEPLLEVEQVGYLDDGRPFEYVISRFPGNFSEYQTIDSDSLPV
ncbi:GntR family transcriptional regulator [Olegusella massiliensis]|uniref:GntR family transcriptional regulator n=1 Tax=Olegusella massiliensis TaxID=1776381 RepID=UPI0003AE57AB|nr:GntR family transcriptional regulator [Olegusella massiliensis]ERL13085.1 UbiC transcription regulator-associated domain protein [Coriobacteriaceae bacterium BV3Ac1]MBS5865056.1 GntR family transcriptional regulator [Coriobacteriaceae bacterium]